MADLREIILSYTDDVADEDVVWGLHVHNDMDDLEAALTSVRSAYPRSRIVVINDGGVEPSEQLVERFQCHVQNDVSLYALDTCHAYVVRLLMALRNGGESYCMKIDPDTRVWRRVTGWPCFTAMFGTLETVTEGRLAEVHGAPNVQGGCIGMTFDAVDMMLRADVLTHSACSIEWRNTWARCEDMIRVASRGQFCDDYVLSWAAAQVGIPLINCPDIKSRWRRRPDARSRRLAVTHPHKHEPYPGTWS